MKFTKIYQDRDVIGRFVCDGRKYTRGQRIMFNIRRITKQIITGGVYAVIIGWVSVGALHLGLANAKTVAVDKMVDTSREMFQSKIQSLKEDVANQLMKCESAGLNEDTGILVFDTNNKASVGQFQFQKATVIHYYKTLYGKDITGKEAVMIALDTEQARQLAIDIMFTTKNKAGKDWVNCNKKYNLDSQIDLIKKIEG